MATTDLHIRIVSPQRRRDLAEPWRAGRTLAELAAELLPAGGGYTAVVDGELIEPEIWDRFAPAESAEVTFAADFGFLAAFLAWAWPTIFKEAVLEATVLGPITWSAVLNTIGWIGASFLVNSLMPKPKSPKLEASALGSSAYSWDPKTTQQEGLPIPRQYGTFRSHGNIISCYSAPSADGRKQNIYALVAFCDGPVESVSNIIVDGKSSDYFAGLTTETKRGLADQTCVSFFDKTRQQYRYNRKVISGQIIIEVPDDDYDDLEIDLRFNIWQRRTSGAQWIGRCNYIIYIRERGGAWTEIVSGSETDSSNDIKWVTVTVSDYYALTRGKLYDLKIAKTSADIDNDRGQNEMYLESVKEVIDVAFTYPGMVLVGLSGLASEDLPGFLNISAEIGRRIVNTYNGSAWSLAASSNPAWVLHDIWTQPLITGDGDGDAYAIDSYQGFSPARIDATDHYTLAQFDSTQVPDADGNDEDRVTFNGIFDRESSMWEAALAVCEVARALPVWSGNKITLAINQAKSRVGILCVGNILSGSFEESFAPQIDAASEIEAEFCDSSRDYERTMLPFHNSSIANASNKVTLDLRGIVKKTETIRHLKHRLSQTELRQRTMVARCDIDALGAEVGDLYGVQEDVPDWNELGDRGGGRVLGLKAGLTGYTAMSCVAHYKLNDNAWSFLVTDSSGNGNHGTAQRKTVNLHTAGLNGGAHRQNGSSDYTDCGDPFESTFRGSHSISIWVKPDDGRPDTNEVLIGVRDETGDDSESEIQITTDGKARLRYISEGNAGNTATTAAAVFADGAASGWTHIVGVFDSSVGGVGGKKIYINGDEASLDNTDDGSTAGVTFAGFTSALNLFIGATNENGSDARHFAGGIDNVMIFGKALTAAEVAGLYNGGAGRESIDYDTITLDHTVEPYIESGVTYELALRLRDMQAPILKTVVAVSGADVEVANHFTGTAPRNGDLWALGKENLVLKDFTIESIERTGNLQSKLTLLEYAAACFETDDEIPEIPVSNAVTVRADRRLTAPLTRQDLRTQVPEYATVFPVLDIPLTHNITWTNHHPTYPGVRWQATTAGNPLLVMFNGTSYEITANDTYLKYIYWDESNPTAFYATDTFATAVSSGHWLMAFNDGGVAYPAFGKKIIHGGLIQAGTITAALGQIADLTVGTLKIINNAVTVPASASTTGDVTVTTTLTTVQTVSMQTTGAPVHINFAAAVRDTVGGVPPYKINQCVITRDLGEAYETTIYSNTDDKTIPAAEGISLAFSYTDQPLARAATTWTIRLKSNHLTRVVASHRTLFALEMKK